MAKIGASVEIVPSISPISAGLDHLQRQPAVVRGPKAVEQLGGGRHGPIMAYRK